jgi:glycosyltransferase involved in cell wall biosynthesis
MASILFYTSIKTRVRDQESLMVEFVKRGHRVFFLNQQVNEYLPSICKQAGVVYETINKPTAQNSILKSFFYFRQLVSFIWKNRIDVVYSHLEPANFIAVFVQFFVKAKVVIVRHHHDLAQLAGFSKDFSYRITYKLAKQVIVVSEATKKFMVKVESVTGEKIYPIRLGYDFTCFGNVNIQKVSGIRERLVGKIILITVGRLDSYKRPEISLNLVKKLSDAGLNVHLFILGAGDRLEILEWLVNEYGIADDVEFLGYEDDVLTYLKASDWLIHPSISESSCVVVKEAGLVELPVIVCKGIGDFDEYLKNEVNSFLVNRDKFAEEAFQIVITNRNSVTRDNIGKALGLEIRNRFHISSVVQEYERFILN